MAHIHTQPGQHDHTVSIYLFRTDSHEPKLMLHLHKKIGSYAQFGGHIELHETPWQTVTHELEEETGYNISQLQILQPHQRIRETTHFIVHPAPVIHSTMGYPGEGKHFHVDSAYAFITNEAPTRAPDEGESTDIKHFSREEFMRAKDVIDPVTYDAALYIFDEILKSWEAVPTSEFK